MFVYIYTVYIMKIFFKRHYTVRDIISIKKRKNKKAMAPEPVTNFYKLKEI